MQNSDIFIINQKTCNDHDYGTGCYGTGLWYGNKISLLMLTNISLSYMYSLCSLVKSSLMLKFHISLQHLINLVFI